MFEVAVLIHEIEKIGMRFEKILNVDDIHYSGYDGELYYVLTKDEYNTFNHNHSII